MMSNFFLHDLLGTLIAFVLFSLVFVIPGYVISWRLDLFNFRGRLSTTKFVIAIVLSIAVSPILTFLTFSLASAIFSFIVLALFAVSFIAILFKTKRIPTPSTAKHYQSLALFVVTGWVIFSILSLIDIQWGNRLYYNIISYDFTTRVAVINAMTRTGVPPLNPSYFPGHPVRLTYLYYFWYIPCSLIAQIGSPLVNGHTAMIASVAWCGLGVVATIALYLRLRNPEHGAKAWKSGLIGSGLLLISGLDFIPAVFLIILTRLTTGSSYIVGDIEQWNEQITAWLGAISWVPHHVAATIACLTGMMLVHSVRNQGLRKRIEAMSIAGLAFASAFGLSVYATIAFVIFWGCWMAALFLQKERQLSLLMILPGIIALIAASPFIVGLMGNSSGTSGGIPIAFAVREFYPIVPWISGLNPIIANIVFLVLLPLNYLMELGLFFITGLIWITQHDKGSWFKNPFYFSEVLLLFVVLFIGSFFRSTTIGNNDLGWRVWLFGQFILLIWATDTLPGYFEGSKIKVDLPAQIQKTGRQLMIFLLLGLTTTIVDISLLRTWTIFVDKGVVGFPNGYSPDTKLGERFFAARTAYEYINTHLPLDIHVQHNPAELLNIPVGLYLNRPMVIAGQTAYGITQDELIKRAKTTAEIFETESTWEQIDNSCKRDFIDVIVVNDIDPLWSKLSTLEQERQPLFQNNYYAVFRCEDFNKTFVQP